MSNLLVLPKDVGNPEEYYQENKDKLKGAPASVLRGLILDMQEEENYELCAFFKRVLDETGEGMEGKVVVVLTVGDIVEYDGGLYTYEKHCGAGCHVTLTNSTECIEVPSNQIKKL